MCMSEYAKRKFHNNLYIIQYNGMVTHKLIQNMMEAFVFPLNIYKLYLKKKYTENERECSCMCVFINRIFDLYILNMNF